MYQGFNGQFLCEYQPWFDSRDPGNNGHLNVGYDENLSQTVAGQDNQMVLAGCNINFVDFYGTTDLTKGFNKATADQVYQDIRLRSDLKFAVLEDEGAFMTACGGLAENDAIPCIVSALEADMTYIHTHYANAPYYWMDQSEFVIGFFRACTDFMALVCPTDWETIWGDVSGWANSNPRNYNFKFIFEFGKFDTPGDSDFQTFKRPRSPLGNTVGPIRSRTIARPIAEPSSAGGTAAKRRTVPSTLILCTATLCTEVVVAASGQVRYR